MEVAGSVWSYAAPFAAAVYFAVLFLYATGPVAPQTQSKPAPEDASTDAGDDSSDESDGYDSDLGSTPHQGFFRPAGWRETRQAGRGDWSPEALARTAALKPKSFVTVAPLVQVPLPVTVLGGMMGGRGRPTPPWQRR